MTLISNIVIVASSGDEYFVPIHRRIRIFFYSNILNGIHPSMIGSTLLCPDVFRQVWRFTDEGMHPIYLGNSIWNRKENNEINI